VIVPLVVFHKLQQPLVSGEASTQSASEAHAKPTAKAGEVALKVPIDGNEYILEYQSKASPTPMRAKMNTGWLQEKQLCSYSKLFGRTPEALTEMVLDTTDSVEVSHSNDMVNVSEHGAGLHELLPVTVMSERATFT
jgi:hypothetical protein